MGDYNLPKVHWVNYALGTSARYSVNETDCDMLEIEKIKDINICNAADLVSDTFASLGMYQNNFVYNSNGYALDLVFTNFITSECQVILDPLKKLDTLHPAILLVVNEIKDGAT